MSIGSQLKQARQSKGITLQEASSKTKIQERFLDAVERDDFGALPNPVYAKGFLSRYAGFLGLDADKLTEEFKTAGLGKVRQVIALEEKKPPSVDSERYLKKAFIGAIAFFVVIGFLAFSISAISREIAKLKRPRVQKAQRVLSSAKAFQNRQAIKRQAVKRHKAAQPAAPVPKSTPPAAAAPAQPAESILLNLSVSAKSPCRLSVKADGKLLFDDFILAGVSDQWQARQRFELDTSDGAAIELTLNGKRLAGLGRGSRKGISITKDGINR